MRTKQIIKKPKMDIERYEVMYKRFLRVIMILLVVAVGGIINNIWMMAKVTTQQQMTNDDLIFIKDNFVSQDQLNTYITYLSEFIVTTKEINDKQAKINDKLVEKYETLMKLIYSEELKRANQVRVRGVDFDTLKFDK